MNPFSVDEICSIVFSMAPDKAPSPDGFTIPFYQKCWDVISCDLLMVLEESRKKGYIMESFNKNNISLIPKVKSPLTFVNFRAISLCNFVYKIITKAIYLRLKCLMPRLISPQ